MAIINGQDLFFFPTGNASGGNQEGSLYRHLVAFTFTGYHESVGTYGYKGCVAVEIINDQPAAYTQETVNDLRGSFLASGHMYSPISETPIPEFIVNSVNFTEDGIVLDTCYIFSNAHSGPSTLAFSDLKVFTYDSFQDTVTKIPVDVIKPEGGNVDVSGVVSQAVAESKSYTDNIIANLNLSGGSTTEATIPTYWASMVTEKTATVKAWQAEGGKNCVSFVWASDTHIPDNHETRTNDIGKVMAKMMDNCDIPFAVISGDVGTRASCSDKSGLIQYQEQMPKHLAPLWGTDKLLLALGNHDGCYGDSTAYYRHQFNPERMWQTYFRGQALDLRRVFSDDGLYFYVDNTTQKTRFIVLNSQFGGEYAEDANGLAVNNRFSTSCYGQEQLDWLANVALDMPEGYGAIITAHVPPNESYTVDRLQLIGIINAYCNKTTFEGSYTAGVEGWSNSTVSVDFTEAKGEILAMFAGHIHGDSVDTKTLACPLITILSAGAPANEAYEENAPTRTVGTDTETSFDVVSINRATKTICCTRIGGGADRVVYYGENPPITPDEPDTPDTPTDYAVNFEAGRLGSSGEVKEPTCGATTCTDYIPAKNGDVVRIKGFGDLSQYNTSMYGADKGSSHNSSKAPTLNNETATPYGRYEYDSTTGIVTITIVNTNIHYIRVSGIPVTTTDDIIITVNEEIV